MACDQVIDSYVGSDDHGAAYQVVGYYVGQAFTMGGTARDICGAKFKVNVVNNGGGISIDVAAKVYACSGTPGTDGMITGAALATSNTIQFTTPQTTWTAFTFSTPYTLNASTNYCIVLECMAVDGNMIVGPTIDSTVLTHAGNMCFDILFGDDYDNTNDVNFYIYYYSFDCSCMTPGYWPANYWPACYWQDDYWPDYGFVAGIERIQIENQKPSYRLTPENQKPSFRFVTENEKPTYRLTVEAQ